MTKTRTTSTSLSSSSNNNNNNNNNTKPTKILTDLSLLLPLLLIYISNQWSRSSLYYLVDFSSSTNIDPTHAMNLELQFNQSQYGLLASLAFTSLFALASLLGGNITDRYDRKVLTLTSCMFWSVCTYVTSISNGYDMVLLSRILMGLSCGFTTPAAYTLIRDFLSSNSGEGKERMALYNSVYGSGIYLGGALSSLTILANENWGWRDTLLGISGYGILCVFIGWTFLPDDPREISDENNNDNNNNKKNNSPNSLSVTSLFQDAITVFQTSPQTRYLFLASFLRFCSGLSIGIWSAPYFRQSFPDDAASYAITNAFIVGGCGFVSNLLGGYLSDFLTTTTTSSSNTNNNNNYNRLLIPILGSILAAPAWYMTIHSTTFQSAMIWLGIEYLLAECWFGPTVTVLQENVKGVGLGGTAQGLFTLTGALGNVAPSILGVLYGMYSVGGGGEDGTEVLGMLLGVGVCLGYVLSGVCFGLSAISSSGGDGDDDDLALSIVGNDKKIS